MWRAIQLSVAASSSSPEPTEERSLNPHAWHEQAELHHTRLSATVCGAAQLVHAVRSGTPTAVLRTGLASSSGHSRSTPPHCPQREAEPAKDIGRSRTELAVAVLHPECAPAVLRFAPRHLSFVRFLCSWAAHANRKRKQLREMAARESECLRTRAAALTDYSSSTRAAGRQESLARGAPSRGLIV